MPLDEIEGMLAAANDWAKVVPNKREDSIARPDAGRRHRHARRPGRPAAQAAMGPEYLAAFTVGDQLLWGAAEPLRRMLRILLER